MPKIEYIHKKFRADSVDTLQRVNGIVGEYMVAGYSLTLRQVYYQLVARGFIPNNERSYKNLGNLINDGRLAGIVDWNAIVDRTRYLRSNSHWDSPSQILGAVTNQYYRDHWENQDNYVEVWVEKDALVDIVSKACKPLDIPFFSCRGYVSQSEMWSAAQRLVNKNEEDKECTILHFGDHDPSGIDMSRDIQDRLSIFGADVKVNRIALTMEQIDTFNPPPNPTKLTDSRATDYLSKFGEECWELDAIDPKTLSRLIESEISKLIDVDAFNEVDEIIESHKEQLRNLEQYL